MKGLLLRVGIDKGSGGCLAPLFVDGTFEYIPIPEIRATSESRVYANMDGRDGRRIAEEVPEKIRYAHPHYDPEFTTFTYGDPTKTKRSQLSELSAGDLLIFYAGFLPKDWKDISRLFVIGYFDVEETFDFKKILKSQYDSKFSKLKNNAHSKIYFGLRELDVEYSNDNLVIVKGKKESSKLLKKALPLGDSRYNILPSLSDIFGYEGSLRRAVGHWIDPEHIQKVRGWLFNRISYLVEDDTVLYSYVLASDTGFAPNTKGGYCTLACCKPNIRKAPKKGYKIATKEGDWVLGTGSLSKGDEEENLLYAMRIEETLTTDEFFHDKRFECKKAENDPYGDNIYYKKNGEYVHTKSGRHNTFEHKKRDTIPFFCAHASAETLIVRRFFFF